MPPSNTNTEIALLKQETQYIKEWVTRLEKKQDEQHLLLYNMLKDMKESFSDNFATKEELKPIREKQESHDKIIERIAWASFFWFLAIIWWIVWVTKFM